MYYSKLYRPWNTLKAPFPLSKRVFCPLRWALPLTCFSYDCLLFGSLDLPIEKDSPLYTEQRNSAFRLFQSRHWNGGWLLKGKVQYSQVEPQSRVANPRGPSGHLWYSRMGQKVWLSTSHTPYLRYRCVHRIPFRGRNCTMHPRTRCVESFGPGLGHGSGHLR